MPYTFTRKPVKPDKPRFVGFFKDKTKGTVKPDKSIFTKPTSTKSVSRKSNKKTPAKVVKPLSKTKISIKKKVIPILIKPILKKKKY